MHHFARFSQPPRALKNIGQGQMRQNSAARILRMLRGIQRLTHFSELQMPHGGQRVGIRSIAGVREQIGEAFYRLRRLVTLQQEVGAQQTQFGLIIRASFRALARVVEHDQRIEKAALLLRLQGGLHFGSELEWLVLGGDERQRPDRASTITHALFGRGANLLKKCIFIGGSRHSCDQIQK